MSVGIWQVVLVVLVVFIIFGAGKLPGVMEDLGRGFRSFKRGISYSFRPNSNSNVQGSRSHGGAQFFVRPIHGVIPLDPRLLSKCPKADAHNKPQ